MSDESEDAKAKAERARKNLKRRARAVEFEAYEDAELRREENHARVTRESERSQPPHDGGKPGGGLSAGRRKGQPSQRGK